MTDNCANCKDFIDSKTFQDDYADYEGSGKGKTKANSQTRLGTRSGSKIAKTEVKNVNKRLAWNAAALQEKKSVRSHRSERSIGSVNSGVLASRSNNKNVQKPKDKNLNFGKTPSSIKGNLNKGESDRYFLMV
jgi:hypothetical protein